MNKLSVLAAAALCASGCAKKEMTPDNGTPQTPAKAALPPPTASRLLTVPAAEFTQACEADMEKAKAQIQELKRLDGAKDGQKVLTAFDDAMSALGSAAGRSSLGR